MNFKNNKQKYIRNEIANSYMIIFILMIILVPDQYFLTVIISITIGFSFLLFREYSFDKKFLNPLNKAHKILTKRYIKLIENQKSLELDSDNILNMLLKMEENIDNWPVDKTSRWMGYIQRYLIEKEITTIEKERDFSRPLFHKAYLELGLEIPKSITVN